MQAFTITTIAVGIPLVLVWILYRQMWHKLYRRPNKWAFIATAISLTTYGWRPIAYSLLENRQDEIGNALADLLISVFFFATVGYFAGFLLELGNRTKSASNSTKLETNTNLNGNNTKIDEHYFEQALDELHSENRAKGLWAKSFAAAEGNEQKAEAKYIEDRAVQMHNQAASEQAEGTQTVSPKIGPQASNGNSSSYAWFKALK